MTSSGMRGSVGLIERRGRVEREKIGLAEMNRLGRGDFVSLLGPVFEGSSWVAERAWHLRPFESVAGLHGAMMQVVREASEERRMALFRAHPDLAGRAAVAGELTAESRGEQVSAGLDRLSPEEHEAFTRLNADYRRRFGFPMIVCVRENTKESILGGARERLGNPREREVEITLGEISKIARLRLDDLVSDARMRERRGDPG